MTGEINSDDDFTAARLSFSSLLSCDLDQLLLAASRPRRPDQIDRGQCRAAAGQERLEALRAQYGLDNPLHEQYVIYLKQLARGDLGMSYRYSGGRTVVEVLSENFRWTLLLVGVSLFLALLIGSALGIWSATKRGDPVDLGLLSGIYVLRSIPPFWTGYAIDPGLCHPAATCRSAILSIPRPEDGKTSRMSPRTRHAVFVLTLAYLPMLLSSCAPHVWHYGINYIRTANAKGVQTSWSSETRIAECFMPVITSFVVDLGNCSAA